VTVWVGSSSEVRQQACQQADAIFRPSTVFGEGARSSLNCARIPRRSTAPGNACLACAALLAYGADDLLRAAKRVHAVFNNCYEDKAVRNATEFREMLAGS